MAEKERVRSGAYKTERGSGQFEHKSSRENGALNRERTITNDQGKTATSKRSTTKNDDGSYRTTGSRTGFNGKSQSLEKNVTRNDDGTISVDKKITGEDGKSLATSKTLSKTEQGWSAEGSYETGQGKTGNIVQQGQKTDNGRVVETKVIGSDGKTYVRRGEYVRLEDGTWERIVTETGPQGKTIERVGRLMITPETDGSAQ